MSFDGLHLICDRHKKETYYCSLEEKWLCIKCELEDK